MKHMKPMALGRALVLAIALAAAGAHAQSQDADENSKAFIKTAIQGNNAEIELGTLALSKGQSGAVKQFGQALVADHKKANEEAKAAANAVGVKPPNARLVSIGTMVKLKAESGNAFDRSFIDAMISDHRKDIKTYEEQSGKNNAVGQYAKQALPTLQKHLQEAERIRQQLNDVTGSK
jgi:putative membrane protein